MNVEKFAESKFYSVCETLWRIVILNFLTLVVSLGIITIIPAFTSCLQCYKDYSEGEDKNVFKLFFINFGKHFKKSFGFSIFFILIMALVGYAIASYYLNFGEDVPDSTLKFYYVGMYVCILFAVVILVVFIQIPLITIYFDFKFIEALRNAFFMSFRYLLTSFMGLLGIILSCLIFLWATPVWFFIGISLPLYFVYLVSKKKYLYLSYNVYDIKSENDLGYEFQEEDE